MSAPPPYQRYYNTLPQEQIANDSQQKSQQPQPGIPPIAAVGGQGTSGGQILYVRRLLYPVQLLNDSILIGTTC